MRYTPDTNRDIPRGHLIAALHEESLKQAMAVAQMHLLIHEAFGENELLRIQQEVRNALSYTCRRVQKGQTAGGRRDPIVRRKLTDQEVQELKYQRYTTHRRTRGVPREGLHVSSLAKPGLFLMEVP